MFCFQRNGRVYFSRMKNTALSNRGVKLIFTGGHISLAVAFKWPNVTLGVDKCNYSLTVKRELCAAAG